MTARAVVLLSGGLDSVVAAAVHRRDHGPLLAAVFCDYGQRARLREEAAAGALCRRWNVPLCRVALPWLAELARTSGSRLLPGAGPLPHTTSESPGDAASAEAVWIPARNAVFVAIAGAHAEALGADVVVAGFNREEALTFPDNSGEFVAAGTRFLSLGTRTGVALTSPTIAWDKERILAEARSIGLVASDVWSCYEGGEQPCGRCESCVRSRWQR